MTAPAMERRSIPTRYKGILFRSKLEADWARFFDACGIAWQYELEGRYFGRTFYLVDFWLPASRQFVEVKGVWQPDDYRKVEALLAHVEPRPHTSADTPDVAIVAAMPEGQFFGWVRNAEAPIGRVHELWKADREVVLLQCATCRGWWFAVESGGWNCQCCGAGGAGHTQADRIASPLWQWPIAPDEGPAATMDGVPCP